jgi:hypothetical protein
VVVNGVSGFVDTRVENLIDIMKELVRNPAAARCWGQGARRIAQQRFGIDRFVRDWNEALAYVTGSCLRPRRSPAEEVALAGRPR